IGELLPPRLAGGLLHLDAQVDEELVHVEPLQQLADGLGAHAGAEGLEPVLLGRLAVARLGQQLALLERRATGIDHDVGLEVEHLLELLQRHVEERADARRQALQEPDVRDGRREVDVAHALAAHLGLDHLDAARLAHHGTVPHGLVLAGVALVVLGRPEDLGAEEAVTLGLEGAVVDGLRLLHLAVRPRPDLLRRGQRDANGVESEGVLRLLEQTEQIFHHRDDPSREDEDVISASLLGHSWWGCSSKSSTSSARLWSSFTMTLNDSGRPGSSTFSPLTMASYMRVRPATSSDFTVSISWRVYAAPYASSAHTSISPSR